MKHRSSQLLFAHWDDKRGRRALPERSAIDPGAIRAALGDTFILAFDRFGGHPVRLAGTRVSALLNGELRGHSFLELWEKTQHSELIRLIDIVTDENVGIVAGARACATDGASLDLELLLLPLHHWGRSHMRLIGTVAPLSVPAWFGTRPIGPLAIGDHRYVGMRVGRPTPLTPPPPVLLPTPPPAPTRQRHGFVVYDGGQA